jgi:aminomethyltransferase
LAAREQPHLEHALAETHTPLKALTLDAVWRGRGAKFGGFAGYDMPITFDGLMAEHAWTRSQAGLFDVSHMGPSFFGLAKGHGLTGDDAHRAVAAIIERVVPGDIQGLKPGQIRYSVLLNDAGGIEDDLMIARPVEPGAQGDLYVVVNAGCKEADWALLANVAKGEAQVVRADDRALLALQGPEAFRVLDHVVPGTGAMSFMTYARFESEYFGRLTISRSGYTGEDGFEVLVRAEHALAFANALLGHGQVKPVGLGARDSLRLEAGLCLYGHDLDATISPIEADLAWIIQKRRRMLGDFPGAARILRELADGPAKKRVGIKPLTPAPAREGVEVFKDGRKIGVVTSGGFGPTFGAPVSMGYVETGFSAPGTLIDLMVRGQPRPGEVVALPFTPHRYVRKGQ